MCLHQPHLRQESARDIRGRHHRKLWYFEIQDSVQHSKAGVDQKPSDLGRWILWRAALFYFYKQLYSPYRGGSRLCIDRGRTGGLVVSDVILGFKKKLLRYQNR